MSLLSRSSIALALALAPFPAPHAAEAPLDPCATRRGALSLDQRTAKMCTTAVSVHPLIAYGDQKLRYLLLLSRARSSMRPQGFCGAGHEDHLVLVALSGRRLIFKDQLLIQSCNRSLSLESDQGDSPAEALILDHERQRVRFRWVGDPDGHQRAVELGRGYLRLAAPAPATGF